jgi:protoporphyrinogen oxidase
MRQVTILGAGISGLATSYHAGHDRSVIYEAKSHYGGHMRSVTRDGFTWDDGPHVSFTNSDLVHHLFAESVDGKFEESEPLVTNYFRGHWIDHPAQSNLYQIPEPLRTQCLESFLQARAVEQPTPRNYQEWIEQAFGPVFANTFPAAYTRKYWTTEPKNLGTDWIGKRVFYPEVEDVKGGYEGPLGRSTYWVKKFRYPSYGGFGSFADGFAKNARINYGETLEWIHLGERKLGFSSGLLTDYDALVSTLPLPDLIRMSEDAPEDVREAAAALRCTRALLVEVAARHPAPRKEQWLYCYDEDKATTRITFDTNFSPHNAPPNCTGIAVEVYGSDYRELPSDRNALARRVERELVEMGVLESLDAVISTHVRFVPWAQVIFDHNRRPALDVINPFLEKMGVIPVGRFADWGYLMTHDCVLLGKRAAERLGMTSSDGVGHEETFTDEDRAIAGIR